MPAGLHGHDDEDEDGVAWWRTGKARLTGYRKALEKHRIPWDESRVKYGDSGMTRGYELCQELLKEYPNDPQAWYHRGGYCPPSKEVRRGRGFSARSITAGPS